MQDRTTAIAIFNDRAEAQRAIGQLKDAGFTEKEIGMTTRETEGAQTKSRGADGHKETHATEGAVTGLAAGAGVGALWGLGILAGVVPAIGPAIAGGTLAAILSSAAAGAAAAGLAGTLIGYGIPEKEAKYYEKEFQSGRTVVTVHAKERAAEAQSIMQRCGGYDMQSATSRDASSTTGARQATGSQRTATTVTDGKADARSASGRARGEQAARANRRSANSQRGAHGASFHRRARAKRGARHRAPRGRPTRGERPRRRESGDPRTAARRASRGS